MLAKLERLEILVQIENLDSKDKVIIVAEIGNNHEGSFSLAKKLIDEAAQAGVDAVKFQTYTASTMTFDLETEDFQINNGGDYSFYGTTYIAAGWNTWNEWEQLGYCKKS